MLCGEAWEATREAVSRALDCSTAPAVELDRLRQQVRAAYQEVGANMADNTALHVLEVDGQSYIVLTPLAAQAESAGLARLRQQLSARLPPVELAALLLEAAAFTDFTGAFTHLADGQPATADLQLSLCAVLLAQACNIGLKSVARPEEPALSLPHLVWVQHSYLRVGALTAANAQLVDGQAQLPLGQHWGSTAGNSGLGRWPALRGAGAHYSRGLEPFWLASGSLTEKDEPFSNKKLVALFYAWSDEKKRFDPNTVLMSWQWLKDKQLVDYSQD